MGPDQQFERNTIAGHARTFKYEASIGHTDPPLKPGDTIRMLCGTHSELSEPSLLFGIEEFGIKGRAVLIVRLRYLNGSLSSRPNNPSCLGIPNGFWSRLRLLGIV